jgi:hypothetical protein
LSRPADPLLRLLGADPETFRPLYRVQKLLLARGVRIIRVRRAGSLLKRSAFSFLFLYAGVYGLAFFSMVLGAKAPPLAAGIALTLGDAFLLLLVITDYSDLLINPREALVLAAHPHDGRSLLLAKVAAIVRVLSALALILFVPAAIAVGLLWKSWLAAAAFLAGAAGSSLATVLAGLLLGAALFRKGGKAAIDRLMPWIQGIFQIGYIAVVGGSRLARMLALPAANLGALGWALPSFWFLGPLALVDHSVRSAALVRLGLAGGTLAFLLFGATRWLGAGLEERLLEPPLRKARRPTRRGVFRGGFLRGGGAGSERGRLVAILRVHLRSDWRTRSEFLLLPMMGAFMILFYASDPSAIAAWRWVSIFVYCSMLMLSADVLTRSSRPESLWWILTAPIDRLRFSWSTVALARAFHLAPLFAALAVLELRAGGSWSRRSALLLELLMLGDLLVVLGKVIFPDFPFSRARLEGKGGSRAELTFLATLLSGGATALLYLFAWMGTSGILGGAALFALLHLPATLWARRRSAAAAADLELEGSGG